IIYMGSHSKKL
ncbi:unnamed protein product, partial [Callosobruchus maculatus]